MSPEGRFAGTPIRFSAAAGHGPGDDTQTTGATSRKVFRILENGGGVNENRATGRPELRETVLNV